MLLYCSRSYWLMLDTTLDEAAIGLCSDPGSNQMVSGSWAGLGALAGADTVSLSTSADSSGEWQWPSGTLAVYCSMPFCFFEVFVALTHLSLASLLRDIGKQHSSRCDAAERGVPSGAMLFAWRNFIEK